MNKGRNEQVKKNKDSHEVQNSRGTIKYEIRNTSGQDLTVCGIRVNPFEKLQVELKEIPKNLKRLEEKGLIAISKVN
jgi:hypothetical protein